MSSPPSTAFPTKTITDFPTETPFPTGSSRCLGDEFKFEVDIKFDSYAEETSWDLKNLCSGEVIAENFYDVTYSNLQTVVQECLPRRRRYEWTIYDLFGDGICCLYGLGHYRVLVDNDKRGEGSDFGLEESVRFGICNDNVCEDGNIPVNVMINFDKYPKETKWSIRNDCTGEVVYTGGNKYDEVEPLNVTRCLFPAKYTFTILDSEGDGICCDFGEGNYKVTYNNYEGFARSGQFKSSESISFGECAPEFAEESDVEIDTEAWEDLFKIDLADGV